MLNPGISIEVNFLFGVMVGIIFTTALFIIALHVGEEKRNKELNRIGVFKREDVNKEFLKTIEGIEENLKNKKQ